MKILYFIEIGVAYRVDTTNTDCIENAMQRSNGIDSILAYASNKVKALYLAKLWDQEKIQLDNVVINNITVPTLTDKNED